MFGEKSPKSKYHLGTLKDASINTSEDYFLRNKEGKVRFT